MSQETGRSLQEGGQFIAQNILLKDVLNALSYPFCVINAGNYTVELANEAALRGPLPQGTTCYQLLHGRDQPCDNSEHPCPLQKAKITKQPVITEHLHLNGVGEIRHVEVYSYPILDAAGNFSYLIEYTQDITERKQFEESLRESESKWRSLIENTPDHIMMLDKDLNIELVNFPSPGLTVEELIGTPLYNYVDEGSEEVKAVLEGVLKTGKPAQYETTYHSPDGSDIYYETYVTPRRLAGSNEIAGLTLGSRDITKRVQIDAEKQALKERIHQNELQLAALEERERIGRELHDDLAQVLGYIRTQTMTAQIRLEQSQYREVQAILDQLTQTTREAYTEVRQYILGIRQSSQKSADRPPGFSAILNDYLETLHTRYGLRTQVSLPDDWLDNSLAPEVETQLLRIIQEALTNVGKHAGVDKASLLFTQLEQELQVIVSDEGSGFYEIHPKSGSTEDAESHFGLKIIRERAEAVGGQLEIRSTPGQGTTIIVRIPRALTQTQPAAGDSIRVLLVDDHPLYLDGLRSLLASRGFQVIGSAHDGFQAQSLAHSLRPNLILMDINMPHCDGLQATKQIKQELPDTKIVMLTVDAQAETLFTALKYGASGYLLKNLDGRQFFDLLANVLEGETILSPEMATRVLAEFSQREPESSTKTEKPVTLTRRQNEVLKLTADGLTNKEIAQKLHVSEATVKYHVSNVLERLQLKSRYQLFEYTSEGGN